MRGRRRKSELGWAQVVNHALFLALIWIVFSGKFDAFHLVLGALSLGVVLIFNGAIRRLSPMHGGPAAREPFRTARAILYFPWLCWQIVVSALYVTKLTLAGQRKIDPHLVRFRSEQPNEVAQVILGNSITLTPGTLTLEIEGDEYIIHALDQHSADGLLSGDMSRRVAGLWGGSGEMTQPTVDGEQPS
ncbi:MAG: Na+/H+ antiporter subunit E [Planctomycetota bacterium]|jgi:multicomponent Na+:H+ antiporter subunit E